MRADAQNTKSVDAVPRRIAAPHIRSEVPEKLRRVGKEDVGLDSKSTDTPNHLYFLCWISIEAYLNFPKF